MNKVIISHLNGKAYQLEEAGFEALNTYLKQAESKLKDNPDKQEIMSDLEQAIAIKCERYLNAQKNVLTTDEVQIMIKEMGPVEDAEPSINTTEESKQSQDASESKTETPSQPKRLYLIMDGAYIGGVCNGIAAYFDVDVTLVRAVFVILAFLTKGAWVLIYFILMMVIPIAKTSEQKAEARGELFNAQELINRAKAKYQELGSEERLKEHRDRAEAWRKRFEEKMHRWGQTMEAKADAYHYEHKWQNNAGYVYASRFGARLFSIVGSLLLSAVSILAIFAVWSLVTHGTVFGHVLGLGAPLWAMILWVVCLFFLVSMPIRHMLRSSYYQAAGLVEPPHFGEDFMGGTFGLLVIAALGYASWMLFPQVQVWVNEAWNYLQSLRTN